MYETLAYLGEFAAELSADTIQYLASIIGMLSEDEFANAVMAAFGDI